VVLARLPGVGEVKDAGARMSGGRAAAPVVVFIAGTGHSGSTLLEMVLGAMPGFVNVGELIDLYRRDAPRSERCGCGEPFASCPFWSGVGRRVNAGAGWDSERLAAVDRARRRLTRQRYLPRLLALPLAGDGFRRDLAAYGQNYAELYRAIADQAGAQCVVDASKWPGQALALARAGLDIRMIHLVRDARGVAYSFGKQGVRRPQAMDHHTVMWRQKAVNCAGGWTARQLELEVIRRSGVRAVRVRYEDFVAQPRPTVAGALSGLGLPCSQDQLSHLGDGRVEVAASHGIAGNPARFKAGEITLRPDEAWREHLPPRDRRLVTALCLPFLVSYGWYPRRPARP
jgi:Sulfotransferase family